MAAEGIAPLPLRVVAATALSPLLPLSRLGMDAAKGPEPKVSFSIRFAKFGFNEGTTDAIDPGLGAVSC